jgi:thiamine transport system ATP-binding protein
VAIAQRPISVLFQDGNLFPHLNVFDNAALALRGELNLHEDERRAVMRSIEKVGLSGFEKRKPAALSGGQQSRAALARVLLRDRPLTLLDEPFAALDPGLRIEMLALIADLSQATGQTVLMATHDFRDAERLCDRIWFMEGGKLVLDAPVAGLRDAAPDLIKAWL